MGAGVCWRRWLSRACHLPSLMHAGSLKTCTLPRPRRATQWTFSIEIVGASVSAPTMMSPANSEWLRVQLTAVAPPPPCGRKTQIKRQRDVDHSAADKRLLRTGSHPIWQPIRGFTEGPVWSQGSTTVTTNPGRNVHLTPPHTLDSREQFRTHARFEDKPGGPRCDD